MQQMIIDCLSIYTIVNITGSYFVRTKNTHSFQPSLLNRMEFYEITNFPPLQYVFMQSRLQVLRSSQQQSTTFALKCATKLNYTKLVNQKPSTPNAFELQIGDDAKRHHIIILM